MLAVGRHFEGQGRRVSRLRVSHAFHSRRMDEMLEPFGRVVRTLQLRPPTVPIISNVTGVLARAHELTTAEYRVLHARRTVRFYQSVQTLERAGIGTYLELGPRSALGAGAGGLVGSNARACADMGCVAQGAGRGLSIVTALGGLYTQGQPVEWSAFSLDLWMRAACRCRPTPFERQRYWLETGGTGPGDVASAGLLSRSILY